MNESLTDINSALQQLSLPGGENAVRSRIENGIHNLLLYNFEGLVQLLYKIDISEQRLKNELSQNNSTDAAVLITGLIIERQKEKQASKQSFSRNKDIPPDEAW
jgi:hypothetical protein